MQFGFNVSSVQPQQSFDLLPPGHYLCRIVRAEGRHGAKPETGEMLSVEFEVLDPQYQGRKLWSMLCVNHQSEKVRQIAQQQLSSICHAIDRVSASCASDIIGHDLMVKVKVKPAEGQWEARNECAGYTAAPKGGGSVAPAAPKAQPWKR